MIMGFQFGGSSIVYTIILVTAVILLAIGLLSLLFPSTGSDSSTRSSTRHGESSGAALNILRRRYDRGELSNAEYEQMRRDLRG
jgi:uncharacterized membrane protein